MMLDIRIERSKNINGSDSDSEVDEEIDIDTCSVTTTRDTQSFMFFHHLPSSLRQLRWLFPPYLLSVA